MSKNTKRFLLLLALGIAYGFMYVMPYMKSSFYDQMIAAMGCTNAQLGSLMTYYAVACTVSYLPGGWIGDKFEPKTCTSGIHLWPGCIELPFHVYLSELHYGSYNLAAYGPYRWLCFLARHDERHSHDRKR